MDTHFWLVAGALLLFGVVGFFYGRAIERKSWADLGNLELFKDLDRVRIYWMGYEDIGSDESVVFPGCGYYVEQMGYVYGPFMLEVEAKNVGRYLQQRRTVYGH